MSISLSARKRRADAAEQRWRRAWRMACAYDGIDPGAPFIVFSADNPHTPEVDALGAQFRRSLFAYRMARAKVAAA